MSGKFSSVPPDEGTKILASSEIKIGELDAMHQSWYFEGVSADSYIFVNQDVENFTDDELVETVVSFLTTKPDRTRVTVKRSDSGYSFVNLNFELH